MIKKKNKKIGTIALNNVKKSQAEWGRWISRGNMIQNIEPVILLLNYGFKRLNLLKIYSLTNVNNKKVISFHKNTPAIYNGTIKSFFFIKNKKTNAVKYTFTKKRLMIFEKKFNLLVKKISPDIIYIDPPYNSRQYSRFYHLLENITKGDASQSINIYRDL